MLQPELKARMEQAIKDLKAGKLIIVADDVDREGEGDLIGVAEFVTPEAVNTMVTKAKGLLCAPVGPEVAARLGIEPMTKDIDAFGTPFSVGLDAKTTSTGVSAFDRAKTIKALADKNSTYDSFYHPGHIFPLLAKAGGVLTRNGHSEAGVDLAKLAGAEPVAYIIEILKDDGTMARTADLEKFAAQEDLTLISIAELQEYLRNEK
ncbi:3,4-dihydroxy-2-butanone-4-phosphate synthase [Fructilactobacillus sp. Tb1]|uniref:3,4-dihydroxy-2-butanone-4-phosphate synthase n=1 Tax=Fructilactobacillus sp. Tb1 TaxID=3422304 RepID=UPI003D2DDB2D